MSLRSIIDKDEARERRLKKQLSKIDRLRNDPKEIELNALLERLRQKLNREKEEKNDN